MSETQPNPQPVQADPIRQGTYYIHRVSERLEEYLAQGSLRLRLLLVLDTAIAVIGGWVLWLGAAGPTIADQTSLGTACFIAITAVLLNLRRAVRTLGIRNGAEPRLGNWQWTPSEVIGSIQLVSVVLLAALTSYMTNYLAQWLITYASLLLAATGLGSLLTGAFRGLPRQQLTPPMASAAAGTISLLLTRHVHQDNIGMLLFIGTLFLIALFTGRVLAYWFDIVVGTIPTENGEPDLPDQNPEAVCPR